MNLQLDTPNNALTQDQIAQINQDNQKKLMTVVNKTGYNILADIVASSQFGYNNSNYTTLGPFEKSFVASGGLIDISFQATINNPTPVSIFIQLIIDNDTQKTRLLRADAGTGINSPVFLFYKEKMSPGNHNVKIQASSSGAFNLCANSTTAELFIGETLL